VVTTKEFSGLSKGKLRGKMSIKAPTNKESSIKKKEIPSTVVSKTTPDKE
jgi:hypothetical protein